MNHFHRFEAEEAREADLISLYSEPRRFSGDPRWITVRYPATCATCAAPILRRSRALYYPNSRTMLCESVCGAQASRDFEAEAFDEAMLSGGSY